MAEIREQDEMPAGNRTRREYLELVVEAGRHAAYELCRLQNHEKPIDGGGHE